jgi:3-oxoadipate enol-lactonase
MKQRIRTGIVVDHELAGEGEPLVLVHSLGANQAMWRDQVPAFATRYRVLTYDICGFGGTAGPVEGEYSVALFAQDLYQLIKELGLTPALLVGHGLGAQVALELAMRRPEAVKGLVLSGSAAGVAPTPTAVERRQRALALLEANEVAQVALETATASFSPGFAAAHPDRFAGFVEIERANDPAQVASVLRAVLGPRSAWGLHRLACPVLVLAGEADAFVPREAAEAAAAAIPGARFVALPGGHMTPIEAPDAFNAAVLEFLGHVVGGTLPPITAADYLAAAQSEALPIG